MHEKLVFFEVCLRHQRYGCREGQGRISVRNQGQALTLQPAIVRRSRKEPNHIYPCLPRADNSFPHPLRIYRVKLYIHAETAAHTSPPTTLAIALITAFREPGVRHIDASTAYEQFTICSAISTSGAPSAEACSRGSRRGRATMDILGRRAAPHTLDNGWNEARG